MRARRPERLARLGTAVGRYAPRRLVLSVAALAIDYEPARPSDASLTRTW